MYLPFEDLADRYASMLQASGEIAEAYYFQGDIESASRLWQTSEQFLKAPEVRQMDHLKFLLRYANFLVDCYFIALADEELMSAMVQRVLQTAEDLQDEACIATALYLSGVRLYYRSLLTDSNDYAKARDCLLRSASLHEKLGANDERSLTLFYIGLTYERQEQPAQAKAHYLRALEMGEQYENKWTISEATRHLTDHAASEEQRLQYALRSLELRIETKNRRALPAAQLLLSDIYLERGDLELALKYCQQAEELTVAMGLRNYQVHAALTRGEIARQQGNLSEAHEQFVKGAEMARQLNSSYIIRAADKKLSSLEIAG